MTFFGFSSSGNINVDFDFFSLPLFFHISASTCFFERYLVSKHPPPHKFYKEFRPICAPSEVLTKPLSIFAQLHKNLAISTPLAKFAAIKIQSISEVFDTSEQIDIVHMGS